MFKFTIRELLLLTVIVGLAAGWWLSSQRYRTEIENLNWVCKSLKAELDPRRAESK